MKTFENFVPEIKNKKNPRELIKDAMKEISLELNKKFREDGGPKKLLNQECQIQEGSYHEVYSKEKVIRDQEEISKKEAKFDIDASLPNVQEYYKEKYGIEGEKEIREKYMENKKSGDGFVQEMAVTIMLYKILPDNYVTVRASKYDDLKGIDSVIVDKNTGEAVCTFDDVCAESDSERYKEKQDKILKKIRKGGVDIKYGISYEDQKLKKCKIENVPAFNLRLSKNVLKELMDNMDYSINNSPTTKTIEIFKQIVEDFSNQAKILKEIGDSRISDKISSFMNMLQEVDLDGKHYH